MRSVNKKICRREKTSHRACQETTHTWPISKARQWFNGSPIDFLPCSSLRPPHLHLGAVVDVIVWIVLHIFSGICRRFLLRIPAMIYGHALALLRADTDTQWDKSTVWSLCYDLSFNEPCVQRACVRVNTARLHTCWPSSHTVTTSIHAGGKKEKVHKRMRLPDQRQERRPEFIPSSTFRPLANQFIPECAKTGFVGFFLKEQRISTISILQINTPLLFPQAVDTSGFSLH